MRLQIDGPHGPKSFFHQVFSSQKKTGEIFTFGVFLVKNIVSLAAEREDDIFFNSGWRLLFGYSLSGQWCRASVVAWFLFNGEPIYLQSF
jgi:hypothetical protein